MTNTKINQIITEEIAAANIPSDKSVKIFFAGNGATIRVFHHSTYNGTYNSTVNGVTTVKHVSYPTVSQCSFGLHVWGIQGEQRVRAKVREYIASVAC